MVHNNMLFLRFIVLIMFFLCLYDRADVQASSDEAFQNYLSNESSYIDLINKESQRAFQATFPDCNSDINLQRREPLALTGIKMLSKDEVKARRQLNSRRNREKKIDDNNITTHTEYWQWIARFLSKACYKRININLLVNAYDFKKHPAIYPLMNGMSKIVITELDKAMKAVRAPFRRTIKNCSGSISVQNTSFLGYRDVESRKIVSEDTGNGWFEKWFILTCNQTYEVDIVILPDPKIEYRYLVRIQE